MLKGAQGALSLSFAWQSSSSFGIFLLVSFEMPRFSCELVCVHDIAVPLPQKASKGFWGIFFVLAFPGLTKP